MLRLPEVKLTYAEYTCLKEIVTLLANPVVGLFMVVRCVVVVLPGLGFMIVWWSC